MNFIIEYSIKITWNCIIQLLCKILGSFYFNLFIYFNIIHNRRGQPVLYLKEQLETHTKEKRKKSRLYQIIVLQLSLPLGG